MVEEIHLITGEDIPFIPAEITIHQPRIKEIAYIGENTFFTGSRFLNFSKEDLELEDAEKVKNISDFTILMSLLNHDDLTARWNRNCVEMVLTLMFPEYQIRIMPNMIAFVLDGQNHIVNEENFNEFRHIVARMFSLYDVTKGEREYNPANDRAASIAAQIKRGRAKAKKLKSMESEGQNDSIISRYISILAVGEQKDINSFKDYTVFQLFDEFQRYCLKMDFDRNIGFRLAGAKDIEQPTDWMKNIHANPNDENI